MTALTIHTMSHTELVVGLDWAAAEGWNPGLQDENSFLAADPNGFLMGLLGDVPVGMVSAVRYGSGFGFIGLYIVLPRFRGQGHGMALWRAGMHALQGRVVGLDGVVAQQDNYRKSGFTLAYNNVRYQGHSQGHRQRDNAVVPLSKIPLQALLRYDSAFFPDDRQAFLQSWVGQPQSTALGVWEAGQLVGYGVCRPCRTGYKIGPLCADSLAIAQRLFTALTGDLTGQSLTLDDIVHRYSSSVAVDHVTLAVGAGELVALLGPSGCGKTTLLRIIAGFIAQTSGRVVVGDKCIDELPPSQRNIGIVFQNYALFPHMTVAENVGYGLAARGTKASAAKKRTTEMLELVQLGHLADRLTKQLSGGQQQRVALARALAIEPRVLLLDEPFSALDKSLRLDMQIEIKRIQRAAGTTTLIVTHDQEEALGMADRVAVLNQGRLEQFAPPLQIYDAPASYFVNQFVGSANVFTGTLEAQDADVATVRLTDGTLLTARPPGSAMVLGACVLACVRPENMRPVAPNQGMQTTVELGIPLGATIVHEVRTAFGARIKLAEPRTPGTLARPTGENLWVKPVTSASVTLFPAP